MTWSQRHKQVRRLVAYAVLVLVAQLPSLTAGPGAHAAPTVTTLASAPPEPPPASVTLNSVTPAVSVSRVPVTISGTIRNIGSVAITEPKVRALIGNRGLSSREAVSTWATSTDEQPATFEVAVRTLGPSLAPAAAINFALVIPAARIRHDEPFAALPISIELVGATPTATGSLASRHTFLPALAAIKAYEPVSVAWLVPLTLDADPALHGMDSAARVAAWTKAIGPGSRLDRLISGTDSTKVTWAIDPAILGPPQVATAAKPPTAPSPTPSPSTTVTPDNGTTLDAVTEATTALANRLKAAAPRHTLWSLPYADPDLAALLPFASASTLAAAVTPPSSLADAIGTVRANIAWPADGTLTGQRESSLRKAFSSQGLAAAVTSASTLTSRSGYTEDASRKSSSGLPLLSYDQSLSRTFAQTTATASGAISIQRFLADSMALLGERPGTPNRSVLVAAPRTFAGNPTVLAAFFTAIASAPWLAPTSTDQLLAASAAATPETPSDGTTATPTAPPTAPPTASPTASPTVSAPPDPLSLATSPLTGSRLRSIVRMTSAINGIASIRDDAQLFRVRWTDAQSQLLSVRWRGLPRRIAAIDAATQKAILSVSTGVRVAPSSVNFFADQGILQVTVVNDLSVPVHDVLLTLTPGQPRLRIDEQPQPLRIGANSRTNVKLNVTAIAAGLVPIEAVLTTANGTALGQNARINVRVQPTSTWIYWVLGVLVGVILVLGVYRSLRRGSTRASRPAPPGDQRR